MSKSKTAEQAIGRSVSHNEIVTLEPDTTAEYADLCKALSLYSANDVENGPVYEFWGTDSDGDDEWRVHVRKPAEEATESKSFTYTIFDGNPATSGGCQWPSHENVEIEADSAEEALEEALREADVNGSSCGEYETGDQLWVIVWDANDIIAAEGSMTLEIED